MCYGLTSSILETVAARGSEQIGRHQAFQDDLRQFSQVTNTLLTSNAVKLHEMILLFLIYCWNYLRCIAGYTNHGPAILPDHLVEEKHSMRNILKPNIFQDICSPSRVIVI